MLIKRTSSAEVRFWDCEPNDAHAHLTNLVDVLKERPSYLDRQRQFLLYASLYGNLPVLGFGLNSYTRFKSDNRISLNVTANAIDALVAKVTKNEAKATFTTMEGNSEDREKARGMEMFSRGQFYQTKFYRMFPGPVLDASIYGTGFIKTSYVDGLIRNERTYPWEVLIDDRAGMYGEPPVMVQRKYYDKDVIADRCLRPLSKDDPNYAPLKAALESSVGDHDENDFDYDSMGDQLLVYEGWRLKTHRKGVGKHLMCIRGANLYPIEDFTWPVFPLTPLRPMHEQMGYWGTGFAEKLVGLQAEINRLLRDIQRAMHLIAKPHWMLESSSRVIPQHLNNDLATIIRYTGASPPQVYVPQAMSSEVYEHLQFLYRTAYEITGISQLSAQSTKPAGLNAAVALRTFHDIESERFTDFVRNCEWATQEVAEKQILIAREHPSMKVKAPGKQTYREITFKDVDLGEDTVIQIYPTSVMPTQPTGQLQWIKDVNDLGLLPPDDLLGLINWPDTDAYVRRREAQKRNTERAVVEMKKGVIVMPEPYDNVQVCYNLVRDSYQEAKYEGVDETGLDCLRKYLDRCLEMMKPPPPPMGAAPEQSQPPALPSPQPVPEGMAA